MEYPEIVTVAFAVAVGKTLRAAVTVTVEPSGGASGAVYNPFELIVPNVSVPPKTPFTYQSTLSDCTAPLVVAPVTAEVKVLVFAVPAVIVQEVGEIVTVGAGKIVTVAVADSFGSSYDTAVTLTAEGEGTRAGA